ncbi:MAG: porin family protein [Bacteroidales bacterium]
MKKTILCIFALFVITTGYSQIKGLTLGPKVGVNFSKISTNIDTLQDNMRPGFEVGAFVRIGNKLYFQPEAMFKTKGGKLDREGTDFDYKVKLRTVDIPLMVGFRLINLKVANLRIMGGPVASFLLNKEVSTDDKSEGLNEDDFKDVNWGLQVGAGVDVLMLTLDLRYEFGLNDVYKVNDMDFKNNLFSIALGWKIL